MPEDLSDTPPTDAVPDSDAAGLREDATVLALIPHFACDDWLAGTIESLLAQSRPLDGIVVIDDASSNPPLDIVARYDEVTLLHAEENVGPYRLVQQVIDDSDHDAILFQDADDWSAPDRLERLLLASSLTGAELVGSDYVLLDTWRWSARRMQFPVDANAALEQNPTGHAQQHPAGLVARALIDRVGGYATGMRFSGDDEFLRRAAHVAKVVNVPRPLYFRRHRPESLTTSTTTGHGSPARQEVLEAMAERALANRAAVAAGRTPDLRPLRSRGPVRLRHLCGPPITHRHDASRGATTVTRQGSGGDRIPRRTDAGVPATTAPPVLVVGTPGSGAEAVACALAQHPAIAYAGDVSWTAEVGASITSAAKLEDHGTVLVSGTRPGTQLDALAVDTDALSRLIAPALDRAIVGTDRSAPAEDDAAPGDGTTTLCQLASRPLTDVRRWVGTVRTDRATLAGVLTVFPDAQVLHVVRDADEVAHCAEHVSTEDPVQAAADWVAGVEVLLDLESALATQIQRLRLVDVLADASTALDGCLRSLGEEPHAAVHRPFDAAEPLGDPPRHPAVPTSTRRLSAGLVGPVRTARDLSWLTDPDGSRDAAAAQVRPQPPAPTVTPSPPAPADRDGHDSRTATPRWRRSRVHPSVPSAVELVDAHVPGDATVTVVSRGDDALLRFRATGRHLPATADGRYAGHHPAGDDEAIDHLEEARAAGARYLLVPSTSAWWLDYYPGFADHLERRGRRVARAEGHELFELIDGDDPPPSRHAAGRATASSGPRRKVQVLSWSVSHNPYGRAHLLADVLARDYDVEVVGATFDRFGGGIWAPLAEQHLPLRTFAGGPLAEMLPRMEEMAATLDGDALLVSKPRLPGLGLAMLAKQLRNRPIVLDVDDHELAFVNASTGLTLAELERLAGNDALQNPFGGPWTRYCDHLIGSADAVTVSNATLQDRYGGEIVGHARDETVFDPARWDRNAVRSTFGFPTDERIILFGGTPRRHKGIVDMAAALRRLRDPRLKLCLIETAELEELADDLAEYAEVIRTVPYQALADLPALVTAADLVCVLQDGDSPVGRYQIPAKVTDALAMRVPCIASPAPPLAGLTATGALHVVEGPLDEAITSIFDDYPAALERADIGREVFLDQLSYAAVRPRLRSVVETQIARARPAPEEHARAIAFARTVAGRRAATHPTNGHHTSLTHTPTVASRRHPRAADVSPTSRRPDLYDIVMFWKQNDTGVYGRRHDMLLDQLARSPRVRRIVQFDHPIGIMSLRAFASEPPTSHGRLLYEQTTARMNGRADDPDGKTIRRTFVYENRDPGDPGRQAENHPPKGTHLDFVRATLAQVGVGTGDHPTVLWGYPKNFHLPDLIEAIDPDLVLVDVVDDHRTWRSDRVEQDEITRHYAEILARADLTLTNCEPMTAEMETLASRVHLVPNGCQWPPPPPNGSAPGELDALDGPVIGYVGNLSSRLDIELLDRLAVERPEWNLVLVGSTHAGRDALHLDIHPNVHLVGPRRAEEARRFIEHFDVAIIPHVDDAMTRRMHPLKAFVYCSAGVPVVSTAIENLDELREVVRVAETHEAFLAQIERTLSEGRPPMTEEVTEVLARHAWTARMADIERLIDDAWARRRALGPTPDRAA